MSRKDTLKAMLSGRDQKLPHGNSDEAPEGEVAEKKLQHIRSGAVGAMGRSLGHIATAADQARALIAAGAAVVEIAPDKIEVSFVSDRLLDDGDDFKRLMDAIRESGQKSPILVRPHPTKPDRYQIAFGHRRVRVLAELGLSVKAVVQNLSDEELVVIQGQENSARSDLSYIERALFALALEARGFDRRVIMSSLALEKTQLSRLMAVGHSIPRPIVEAIGPAPKAGRPRWAALAEQLAKAHAGRLDTLLESRDFKSSDSDSRFNQVMKVLSARRSDNNARVLKSDDGKKLGRWKSSAKEVHFVGEGALGTEFAKFIADEMPSLVDRFTRQREDRND